MVRCNRCNQALVYADGELRCPSCGKVWNEILLSDETYFKTELENNFNSLIAYEYHKLKNFIEQKQVYGAILQIKDIYEVFIKFPVLLCACYMFHNKTDETDKLLVDIVTTRNSMGDWHNYLRQMQNKIKNVAELSDLYEVAKLTNSFCNKNEVVSWRNQNIGHGATREMGDENLYEDLFARIQGITDFLTQVKPHYDRIRLTIDSSTQSVQLVGHNNLIANRVGKPYAHVGDKTVELRPFFYLVDDGLYFYDNFISKKSYLHLVEYPRGKRDIQSTHVFDEMCNGQADNTGVYDSVILDTEIAVSNNVLNVTDFIEPKFITQWIEQRLENEDKVFMLLMQKGMGKSTLIRALDPFQMNSIKLPDTKVRTYYINPTYGSTVSDFTQEVNRQLKLNDKGDTMRGSFYFPNQQGADPRMELATALNTAKSIAYGGENLLFIIDGLDELRPQAAQNITDYIPTPDMLDEGVYVMLTSRTLCDNDNVTYFTRNVLHGLSHLPTLELHVNDKDFVKLKERYFVEHIIAPLRARCHKKAQFTLDETKQAKFLTEISNDSMLYLRQLKELLEIKTSNLLEQGAKVIDCNALLTHSNKSLLDEYFASLKNNYGDKYFTQFSRLMVALTLTDDYLTIHDLAALVANDNLSLAFMGFLNTIRMFLTVKRTNYGNAYRISHLDNIQYIKEHMKEETLEMAEELYRKMLFILGENTIVDYSDRFAMTYFAYLLNVARTFRLLDSTENYKRALQTTHSLLLNQKLIDVSDNFEEQILDRNIMYQQALLRYAAKHCDKHSKEQQLAIARSYMLSGGFRFAQRDAVLALEDYRKAFEILAKLPLTDDEKFEYYFSMEPVYLYMLSDLKQYEQILVYADYADKIFDELKSRNYPFTPISLNYHASIRGYYYQSVKQWEKSLPYEVQALKSLEHYSTNEEKWLYAARLSNTGKTLTQIAGHEQKALEYMTRATELFEECVQDNYVRYVKELFYNYRRLSVLYGVMNRFDDAIEAAWKAIRYLEQKERENLLVNKLFIVEGYYHLCKIYFDMGDYTNCRKYLDEASTKLNHMDEANKNKPRAASMRVQIAERYDLIK
ncbi:MAG: AAA family ATPase [Clostridiales bacterium]|nr:AAA family ATPase [Clostridiales bacterium]